MDTRKPLVHWLARALGTAAILLLCVGAAQGGDPRAAWFSTGFQAVNLDVMPQAFVARFLAPDGTAAYTLTATIPPGEARFYEPAELAPPLPDGFTGTLAISAAGQLAFEVLHLSASITGSNMVLEGAADPTLGTTAYVPIHRCIALHIHNLALQDAGAVLSVFDVSGNPVGIVPFALPPEATVVVLPVLRMGLPLNFVGLGTVAADQPVEVTVRWICDGQESYVAAPAGAQTLFLPAVSGSTAGAMTTTLLLHNPSSFAAQGTISFSNGAAQPFVLPMLATIAVDSPFTATAGAAVIQADAPLVASAVMRSREVGREGAAAYRALGAEEATTAVALPVILDGYEGWYTGDRLWVQNAGLQTATVTIRYTAVPTGTLTWQEVTVPPRQSLRVTVPDLPAPQAAALLWSDQPILAVAGAFYPLGESADRWILYRGTGYTFDCNPIVGADMAWQPLTPTVGQTATFTATAGAGTAPVSFTWALGDGTAAAGAVVAHAYTLPGSYTVTLTATNCLGLGQAAARRVLVVTAEPALAYLPVVVK